MSRAAPRSSLLAAAESRPASPWHEGETALQERLGVADHLREIGGRVIRGSMTEQHRSFYPLLPFVVLGAVDRSGDPWATLRAGAPGFLRTPDPLHLRVGTAWDPDDPAEAGLEDGDAVALLGIDLPTRRRNRLNGTVLRRESDGFAIHVEQSFGNCPKYIRVRRGGFVRDPQTPAAAPVTARGLEGRSRALVAAADTFFVASYAERGGGHRQVDVSHRGGPPGFVRIGDDGALTIPDYAGNRFFNTLGNLVVNPRAGLAFADFETGDLLQMTGRADVVLDGPDIAALPGAERLWRFSPGTVVLRERALPLRFAPLDAGRHGRPPVG